MEKFSCFLTTLEYLLEPVNQSNASMYRVLESSLVD